VHSHFYREPNPIFFIFERGESFLVTISGQKK